MQKQWLLLIAGLITLGILYLLNPILAPFAISFILAYLTDPWVDRLEAKRVPRTLGVTLVFALLTLITTLTLLFWVPLLIQQLSDLQVLFPKLLEWFQEQGRPWLEHKLGLSLGHLNEQQLNAEQLKQWMGEHWQSAKGLLSYIAPRISQSTMTLLAFIGNLALIPVVTFYLLRDWDILMQKLRSLLPPKHATRIVALTHECDQVLSAFLRGQLMVMLLLALIYSTGLAMTGIHLGFLIGAIAGLLSIVPYLGFAAGITIATLVAIFQFQDLLHPMLVIGIFLMGQVIESSLLTPWLVGNRIGLHPVAVIFAVLAGGQLFGFVGLLLALPISAILVVLLRHGHYHYQTSQLNNNA